MIANFQKILAILAFSSILLIATAGVVLAYFEFDHDQLWGQAVTKTTLSDGRIRMSVRHQDQTPLPESIRNAIEAKAAKSGVNPVPFDPDTMHFSGHYDVVMGAQFRFFNIDEHSDVSRMVCHEAGDINMRLSLFAVTEALLAALNRNEDFPVILTAKASEHQCHGNPIFRKIESFHVVSGSDEVLLITSKARYEELWDDADIDIAIQHPLLTHVNSHKKFATFDQDALDHGANWNTQGTTKGASLIRRHSNLVYRREQADNDEGGIFSSVTGSHIYQVKGHGASNAIIAKTENRKGETQWGCGCRPKIKRPSFKKVVKAVKKTAKKATSSVSTLVKATGKGIVAGVNALKNLFTFSANVDKTLKHTFSSCDQPGSSKLCDKPMIGLLVTFEMKFTTTFRFKFKLSSNKVKLFHTSLTGALTVGAGARTQSYQDGDGQVTLFTIPGPKITFMIGVIPVWILVSFPIHGGVSITYGTKDKPFSAGYSLTASATIGVEWTDSKGFSMLTSKDFTKGYEVNYPRKSPADITVSPYVGVQARFALYGMIVGYPQVQFGLDNNIKVNTASYCKVRLYTKMFIRLSAGLDFELVLKKITIFRKSFGPWQLYKWTKPVYNYCMREIPTLPPRLLAGGGGNSAAAGSAAELTLMEQHAITHDLARAADLQEDASAVPPPTTELTDEDNGKVWVNEQTCGNNVTVQFETTGYFTDGMTYFHIVMSRNVTFDDGNYSLVSQSMLMFVPLNLTRGMSSYASIVPISEEVAEMINVTYEDLQALTTASSGSVVQSIPLTDINFTFSADSLDEVQFYSPLLCGGKKMETNSTSASSSTDVRPSGSMAAQLMSRLGPQFAESFMTLITGTLAIVLSIAVVEIIIVILLPKIVGAKWFPKKAETPRYREYVYGVVCVVVGAICYIMFIIGGAIQYADITGARVDPNYVPPPPGANEGDYLTASGVEVLSYSFAGADVTVAHCPQYYPCSPNCRDLCDKRSFKWTSTPWPYCPSSAIITEAGGCTKFAWDAIIDAVFSFIFLCAGCALPLIKFSNIYRRMPLSNAFLLLSGMCLQLLQMRVESFLKEVRRDLFDPADGMITPFQLSVGTTSEKLFQTAVTAFWILCGVQGLLTVHELLDYYKQTKDGKIVHLTEDLMSEVEESQMKGVNEDKASVSKYDGELNESTSSGKQNAPAQKAFPVAPSLDL